MFKFIQVQLTNTYKQMYLVGVDVSFFFIDPLLQLPCY